MRMSCNGCRVLRKGCSSSCSIRPCLQWIKSSECQANATLFLAKFYGRAGLLNLINSSPHHQRSEVFRSLLYEACGRIVNPIYGSVGLLSSGNWHKCQAAVEAVLRGDQPITHGPPEAPSSPTPAATAGLALPPPPPPLNSRDIPHVHSGRSKPSSLQCRRRRRCPVEGNDNTTTTSNPVVVAVDDDEVELDLTLGLDQHNASL